MKRTNTQIRTLRAMVAGTLVAAGALAGAPASAGGLLLYEIGTEDVGLASAGYTARAQDASTVFTNPAGMTRLEGSQFTAGVQALYGDLGFSIGQGTSPGLGSGDRRQSRRLVSEHGNCVSRRKLQLEILSKRRAR